MVDSFEYIFRPFLGTRMKECIIQTGQIMASKKKKKENDIFFFFLENQKRLSGKLIETRVKLNS